MREKKREKRKLLHLGEVQEYKDHKNNSDLRGRKRERERERMKSTKDDKD